MSTNLWEMIQNILASLKDYGPGQSSFKIGSFLTLRVLMDEDDDDGVVSYNIKLYVNGYEGVYERSWHFLHWDDLEKNRRSCIRKVSIVALLQSYVEVCHRNIAIAVGDIVTIASQETSPENRELTPGPAA
jgi:hypothetical protein